MARQNLSVPFHEKDDARAAGARWDKDGKTWYVSDREHADMTTLARWLPETITPDPAFAPESDCEDLNIIKDSTGDGYLIDAKGKKWVTMSNALIRAAHGLTLSEKRIVCIALAKLDPRQALLPSEVPTTRITAEEYAELAGCDMSAAYEALQASAKVLYERSIKFYTAAHRRRGKPLPPTEVHMRWVGQVHYQKGEGWAELYWWPKLLPYLTGLRKQFTKYQLEQGAALRSEYSWRLLELLMRFQDTGWAEYTIEDFCASLGATEKQASNFAWIRRRMIEPAVKELTEKDDWLIEWKPLKKGRKVAAVRFEFKRNEQLRLL